MVGCYVFFNILSGVGALWIKAALEHLRVWRTATHNTEPASVHHTNRLTAVHTTVARIHAGSYRPIWRNKSARIHAICMFTPRYATFAIGVITPRYGRHATIAR